MTDRLLGPGGCPWDQEQTFRTLQRYLLEEVHELLDAMDRSDAKEMVEEVGDVLFSLIFISKIAEKEKLFTLEDAAKSESDKLIRRHPHIFAEEKVSGVDDIVKNWEAIKKQEKSRESIMDGMPPQLPTLLRAQKVVEKLRRAKSSLAPVSSPHRCTEQEIAERLWQAIADALASNIDAEGALRRFSNEIETRAKKNTGD